MDGAEWQLVTGPTVEPLTTAEAKAHLRVDASDEDTLIDGMVKAARISLENELSMAFITQTWKLLLRRWPACGEIKLPRPPLASVVSVIYTDIGGTPHTVDASNYSVVTTVEPGRVVLAPYKAWPTDSLYTGWPIVIQYTCGYGAAGSAVPEPLRMAMRQLVGHFFENREAVTVAAMQALKLPMSVDWQLEPYRYLRMEQYP